MAEPMSDEDMNFAEESAWKEGTQAYSQGVDRKHCPYIAELLWTSWHRGWLEARAGFEGRKAGLREALDRLKNLQENSRLVVQVEPEYEPLLAGIHAAVMDLEALLKEVSDD